MAELYLVRHAQASYGSDDYDQLSEVGHRQSKLLGEYFSQRDISFDRAIYGGMKRHLETIQGALGDDLKFEAEPAWREFAFEEVIKDYLHKYPNQKPAPNAPRKQWYRLLKLAMLAWSNNELSNELPESWGEFNSRVVNATKDIQNSNAKSLLVVSSGGAIAIFLKHILGLDTAQTVNFNLQIKNSSIHHFYFNKDGFQMSAFNSVPHLESIELKDLITFS